MVREDREDSVCLEKEGATGESSGIWEQGEMRRTQSLERLFHAVNTDVVMRLTKNGGEK